MPIVEPLKAEALAGEARTVGDWVQRSAGGLDMFSLSFAHSARVLWSASISKVVEQRGLTFGAKAAAFMTYVISKENACPYCVPGTELMLRLRGFSDRQIAALRERAESPIRDRKTELLLSMAHRSVRESHRFSDKDRKALLDVGLTPAQLVEAAFACGASALGNRYATALQVMPDAPVRLGLHPILGWLFRPLMRLAMRKALQEPQPA